MTALSPGARVRTTGPIPGVPEVPVGSLAVVAAKNTGHPDTVYVRINASGSVFWTYVNSLTPVGQTVLVT